MGRGSSCRILQAAPDVQTLEPEKSLTTYKSKVV